MDNKSNSRLQQLANSMFTLSQLKEIQELWAMHGLRVCKLYYCLLPVEISACVLHISVTIHWHQ